MQRVLRNKTRREWCSGCAEIDILSSRDEIQQTIERSLEKENCKH